LLQDATFFLKYSEEDETYLEKCRTTMDKAHKMITEMTRESYADLTPETVVWFAEVALSTKTRDEEAERVLNVFFQRIG